MAAKMLQALCIISSLLRIALSSSSARVDLAQFANVRCNGSTIGTPSYGNGLIIYTVCAERDIDAHIDKIYNTLVDFKNYHKCNSFVQNVTAAPGSSIEDVPPPVGTKMNFTNIFPPLELDMPSVEELSFAELEVQGAPGVAVNAWKSFDAAEHPNVLTDLGGGRTRYVSHDSSYGALGISILPMKATLQELFEAQAGDLKRYVENPSG